MKQKILCLLLAVSLFSCDPYTYELKGEINEESFTSQLVGDAYTIYTYLPENYEASKNYPVIFLLDGDWYFDDFSRALNDLIQAGSLEPAILVGIGYPSNPDQKRFRDYTFPPDPEYDVENGKADVFQQFLATELVPKIEADYSTDTTSYVLMGHSLGGLNTLFNCFQTDSPFDAYVAVSASIWWSNGFLFGLEEQMAEQPPTSPTKVYIAVGGDEPPSMTSLAEELTERLNNRNYTDFSVASEVFESASHSQVPMIGFRNGIQNVFN
jgi:predicted alpha/beta superfamily hydrolase